MDSMVGRRHGRPYTQDPAAAFLSFYSSYTTLESLTENLRLRIALIGSPTTAEYSNLELLCDTNWCRQQSGTQLLTTPSRSANATIEELQAALRWARAPMLT
jgi:hypothetical protein